MDGNFLAENLGKTRNILDKISESDFVLKSLLLFSDEFKKNFEIENSLHDLYKNIKDVIFCVIENKDSMEKTCLISNGYEFHEDSVGDDEIKYLIVIYLFLMRFLIEYTYRKYDDPYIERMVYAIDDYHSFDFIYKNIDIYRVKVQYLYIKNVFFPKLSSRDIQNVDSKVNNFKINVENIDLAISRSGEILNKYNELKSIDNDYFDKFKNKLKEISQELESGILSKVAIIEDLDKKVNHTNDNLTLKGLSEAYSLLGTEKNKEKIKASRVLKWSILSVFVPLIIRLMTLPFDVNYSIYGYILTGTATLIFIYYFRVALINYNSIKAELNQINLRTTLCMFIQGYVEFSQRNDNHDSLSKFESLIFSNIVSDDKNIPTTLDGLDQLAKLISALKAK
ncbi:hypothetical protein [Providencia rettgeri]|uniref:hypothetical protein n=1 Tax=Providencia rettgeri TaxID=587 RepID=UPI00226E4C0A|nr:hypothetical protein [Providencia rettgeri]MCX9118031.1 hypothetical protein [Providencia rettgeri]